MFDRELELPENETFFLWGARQTGKSTLLKKTFSNAYWVDLLKSDIFLKFFKEPWLLREYINLAKPQMVVIDEIQKIPALLDEVHWMIENTPTHFALCGSSARKVKRGHANLLGGRALRYELNGLTAFELKEDFDIIKILNRGYLPSHYSSNIYLKKISSYISDYIKEEILSESLVRKIPAFSNFLELAALSDTEFVNYSTFARDVGVSSETIKQYYNVLNDTLLGKFLPGYTKRLKRRTILKNKFYFFDVGVVNVLAKRKNLEPKTAIFGKAFENWVFHELSSYNIYKERAADLFYWLLPSGLEVDFIVNDMEVAIESKASYHITSDHLKGLRSLSQETQNMKHRIVVSLEQESRKTEDGILILSVKDFVYRLWNKEFF